MPYPRPIITKVSIYQEMKFIKSHIKMGAKFGVADDSPKEVDARQESPSTSTKLKKARREQKTAFFNVEKLLIYGVIWFTEAPKLNIFQYMAA